MNAPLPREIVEVQEIKVFTGAAQKVLKLLGAGCTQVEAARAAGVDESYVSQLQNNPEFKAQVDSLIKMAFETQSAIDANYIKLEHKLSERLLGVSEHEYNPDRILRMLKFANEAKKKVAPNFNGHEHNGNGTGAGAGAQVAVLVLPTQIIREFVKDPMGMVLSVDGKELSTLPSKNMETLVERTKLLKLPKKNGSGHSDPYADL